MFVLFEERGIFKTAEILSETGQTFFVETPHGKRIKIKQNQVLLNFNQPSATELLALAKQESLTMDTEFLWEVSPDIEFNFTSLSHEYFGEHPSTIQQVAILLHLQEQPIYFHRKGKGMFIKAPTHVLQAALLGLEKKQQQLMLIDKLTKQLCERTIPDEFKNIIPQLLYRPDRNRSEVKALEAACIETGLSAPALFMQCGAIESSYTYHLNRFLFEFFESDQQDHYPETPHIDLAYLNLPTADVQAFSIDDSSTTEIDDALSVTALDNGGWKIGIHIAAPALGFKRDSDIDLDARRRLSTVYMPGHKITMLPDPLIQQFSLDEHCQRPAVSLYLTLSSALSIIDQHTQLEFITVKRNLRLHELEPDFTEANLLQQTLPDDLAFAKELSLLWQLATILEAGRGKETNQIGQIDYTFKVDWSSSSPDGLGSVAITPRLRGAPIDKLISELMIYANSTWGKQLAEASFSAIYRVQNGGKVHLSTHAEPHNALGVDCYGWFTSPLRRYIDLVNQWQLIAMLKEQESVFLPKSPDLFSIIRDFDLTYNSYLEFQRAMERYWCLRWLRQDNKSIISAIALRDNVVKIENCPFVTKVDHLPPLMPNTLLELEIEHSDLLDISLKCHFLRTIDEPTIN